MMLDGRFLMTLAVVGALLAGALPPGGSSAAQTIELPPDTPPAIRALLSDPIVQRAVVAARKGDFPRAAMLLREGARYGNPSAQVMLAQLDIGGQGVPRYHPEALKWLEIVLDKHEEPAFSVAAATLQSLRQKVGQSGTDEEKAELTRDALETLLKNPFVQQWLKNAANTHIITCFGWVWM